MKYVRQATLGDLSEISAIFEDAKKVLSNDGSSQWQNGSPSIENFKKDIEDGCCYVLIVDEEVAGMASLIEGPDKNYQRIDSGMEKTFSILRNRFADNFCQVPQSMMPSLRLLHRRSKHSSIRLQYPF